MGGDKVMQKKKDKVRFYDRESGKYLTLHQIETRRNAFLKEHDPDFYDLEGGVQGPWLKGSSTISLFSLANRTGEDNGLSGDSTLRQFDDVADRESDLLNFSESGKARYYHVAGVLATQAIADGVLSDEACHTWNLHARGFGERHIAEELDIPRSRVRKYLALLRTNIRKVLDSDQGV
jgi:hypothetical protein